MTDCPFFVRPWRHPTIRQTCTPLANQPNVCGSVSNAALTIAAAPVQVRVNRRYSSCMRVRNPPA